MAHQPPLRPSRYRSAEPPRRTQYPSSVLLTMGAVGVLVGVLVWVTFGRDSASSARTVTRTVTTEARGAAKGNRPRRTTTRRTATTPRTTTAPPAADPNSGAPASGGELESQPAGSAAPAPSSSSTGEVCAKQPDGTFKNCSTGDLP